MEALPSSKTSSQDLSEILLQESAYFTEPLITVPATFERVFFLQPAEGTPNLPGEFNFNFCEVWRDPHDEKKTEASSTEKGIDIKNYTHKNIIPLKLVKTESGCKLIGAPNSEHNTLEKFLQHYSKDHCAFVSKQSAIIAVGGYSKKKPVEYLHSPVSEISIATNYIHHRNNLNDHLTHSLDFLMTVIQSYAAPISKNSSLLMPNETDSKQHYDFYEWHRKDMPPGMKIPTRMSDIKRIRFARLGNTVRGDVTYLTGNKESFGLEGSKSLWRWLDPLEYIGARHWHMLWRVGSEKIDWSYLKSIYSFRDANVQKDYDIFHKIMEDDFVRRVRQLAQECKGTQLHINLIDAGCGQSPELVKKSYLAAQEMMKTSFPKIDFSIDGLGFDFEEVNVNECNEDRSPPSAVRFIRGDFNHIEKIIESETRHPRERRPEEESHTIVLSSGSLTRNTLNHSFECARIFQGMWRSNVNSIIAGGETEFEFVERMLKRIGYSIKKQNLAKDALFPVYTLERISTEALIERLIKQIQKKSTLDLSMSPDPLLMLSLIHERNPALLKKITSIDLSFTDIHDYPTLNRFLDRCSGLKEIKFLSNDLNALKNCSNNILKKSTIRLTDQYIGIDESFLFASPAFYRRFQYEQLESLPAARLFSRYVIDHLPATQETVDLYDYFLKSFKKNRELFDPETGFFALFSNLFSNKKELSPQSIVETLLKKCPNDIEAITKAEHLEKDSGLKEDLSLQKTKQIKLQASLQKLLGFMTNKSVEEKKESKEPVEDKPSTRQKNRST